MAERHSGDTVASRSSISPVSQDGMANGPRSVHMPSSATSRFVSNCAVSSSRTSNALPAVASQNRWTRAPST